MAELTIESFDIWKMNAVTELFMHKIDSELEVIKELFQQEEVLVSNNGERHRLLGRRDVLELIKNLSIEDLTTGESNV